MMLSIISPYYIKKLRISHQTSFQMRVLAFANVISYKFPIVVNESAIPMVIKLVINENAEVIIDITIMQVQALNCYHQAPP